MKNTGMIRIPGGISERGKRIISNSILEGVDGIRTNRMVIRLPAYQTVLFH